jgi:hypothetical protein
MTAKKSPWDNLLNNDGLNVRRATKPPTVPFYYGKDSKGSLLLIAELSGDHKDYFFSNKINVTGIDTSLKQYPEDSQNLFIKLTNDIDKDIFEIVCFDLLKKIHDVSDPKIALSVTLNHLKRWKSFMKGSYRKVLSPQEVRGLFAELSCLFSLLQRKVDHSVSVEAWRGPDDSHQDFIFMNSAIEIKALSGKERNSVSISSLDQLQKTVSNLYLKIYRLGTTTDQKIAKSLNELVGDIENKIDSPDVTSKFLQLLSSAGYVPLDEYNKPNFLILNEITYLVTKDFPKLTKAEIPSGINKARYELDLSAIEPYITDNIIHIES